jgi:hypothetical protein
VNKTILFVIGLFGGVGLTLLALFALDVVDFTNQEDLIVQEQQTDTVYLEQKPKVVVERVVEKVDVLNTDTVMLLTNINQSVDSGDYVVLRDKLLHSQRVKIVKNLSNKAQASDQLIDRMSSDDFFSDNITVEFWESPIDYQGYRLNKTKLILFGINPNESFMLTQNAQGELLMQTGAYSTLLQATEKYRSFTFQ